MKEQSQKSTRSMRLEARTEVHNVRKIKKYYMNTSTIIVKLRLNELMSASNVQWCRHLSNSWKFRFKELTASHLDRCARHCLKHAFLWIAWLHPWNEKRWVFIDAVNPICWVPFFFIAFLPITYPIHHTEWYWLRDRGILISWVCS